MCGSLFCKDDIIGSENDASRRHASTTEPLEQWTPQERGCRCYEHETSGHRPPRTQWCHAVGPPHSTALRAEDSCGRTTLDVPTDALVRPIFGRLSSCARALTLDVTAVTPTSNSMADGVLFARLVFLLSANFGLAGSSFAAIDANFCAPEVATPSVATRLLLTVRPGSTSFGLDIAPQTCRCLGDVTSVSL
mmetsp:Transcript_63255/g.167649  ORF Transcript_63255/g.167649 Transcript_63255/m.167649 type:complete len:192 (-) Transcript_63255:465-1040(-)